MELEVVLHQNQSEEGGAITADEIHQQNLSLDPAARMAGSYSDRLITKG
jgi:hypothetical protein